MTRNIEVMITRHEKKATDMKPEFPGDKIDRALTLSAEGFADAQKTGKTEFGGKSYDAIYVLTSDLFRTQQTAEGILKGAGLDPENLHNHGHRATFRTNDRIGLCGTNWSPEGAPSFKNLNEYVTFLMENHYLKQPGKVADYPVMAMCGGEIIKGLADGIEDVSLRLKPKQNGLVLVVTHAPIIDAAAVPLAGKLRTTANTKTGSLMGVKNPRYTVEVDPFEAHDMGEYMRGTLNASTGLTSFNRTLPLHIKGQEYQHKVGDLYALSEEMIDNAILATQVTPRK